jgi:hypothetical protein
LSERMDMGQPRYISYLLRLWQVEDREGLVWRLSLESPHTGEHRGFADLAALCSFLESQCANLPPDVRSGTERRICSPQERRWQQ